jgi:3-mercaptopyruvate sulfurtransferase SseA
MSKKRSGIYGLTVPGLAAICLLVSIAACADEAQRMSVEELKGLLNSPDVIILDVRSREDWAGSNSKIKGAIRETSGNVKKWSDKYPKDKTLVLYCA